jgi:heme exporter protein D
MDQLSSLLHLGGYGVYVWPAYGVAGVVLIGLLWRSLASLRANERLAAHLQKLPMGEGAGAATGPREHAGGSGAARHEPAR